MPSFVQLTFRGQIPQACWFTFSWSTENGVISDISDLASSERDSFNGEFAGVLSDTFTMNQMSAIWWPAIDTPAFPTQTISVATVTGTDDADELDARQTLMIEFKTFLAKPSPQRKRCFIGRYTEDSNDGGVPAGATTDAFVDWADSHISPLVINTHTFTPVSLQKAQNPEGGVVINGFGTLVDYLLPTDWAWMNSRRNAKGI